MSALSRRIALSMFLAGLAGLSPALAQQQAEAPPPTVTVVTLHVEDVPVTTTLPGRVTASAEAEVRPQVNGIVTERLFDEGRRVKVGDPLFRIDKTTYEAAVAQAEAAVAQARAQADNARREAERAGALRDRRVASESTSDTAIAARDAAEAAVKVAEAQLQTARIELDRTTIRAELDGEIGLAQVSQGALVTAGQATPLAVIRALDPVHVDVTQSAAEVVRWRRDMAAVQEAEIERPGQQVTLRLADGTEYGIAGTLTAAEPFVNETTGVITLRLSFPNPESILLPGMYVQAVVQQRTAHNAILAPQEGVSRDRRGQPIALVVNAQNQVEQRDLTILQDHGNSWIVTKGLSDGDRLIVEGVQKIGPGMPVVPEERQAAGTQPAAPAGQQAQDQAQPAAGAEGDELAPDQFAPVQPAPVQPAPEAPAPGAVPDGPQGGQDQPAPAGEQTTEPKASNG